MSLSLISFLLVSFVVNFTFLNSSLAFEKINTVKEISNNQLAEKYCDSLGKNLFKGLDKESILKYEYFFSSIPQDYIKDKNKFLENFKTNVKSICSYQISKANEEEFDSFLDIYFKTKSNTPKIKAEETNPILINPAIIEVFK